MISPSTQNLKTLGLRVFFLILNVELTLEYLTIFSSSESPSSILVHSPSSGSKQPLLVPPFTHLYTLAWNIRQEDFWYRVKLSPFVRWQRRTINSDITCWENPKRKHLGDKQEWDKNTTHIRKWHNLQPKTLRH